MRTTAIRRAAFSALALAVIVVLVIVIGGSSDSGHKLTLTTNSADLVRKGLAVRAAGNKVGVVTDTKITKDFKAFITMRVDDSVWPLPADSKAQLRWGGTIKFTDRFIELDPGKAGGATIPDGGSLKAGSFTSPVEADTLLNTFDGPTRSNLRATLDQAGQAFANGKQPFRRVVKAAPPALDETAALLNDLGTDQRSLDSLLVQGDRVVNSIQQSDPGVRELLDGAETTFTAVAAKATALQQALAEAPDALNATRTTLAHANPTLLDASTLTRRLAPAIPALLKIATPLNDALLRVTQVAPDLQVTLRTARTNAPTINKLLTRATTLSPRLDSVAKQATIQVGCLRPYSPSLAGLLSTWTDAWGHADGIDKYLRAVVGTFPYPNATPLTAAQVVKTIPSQKLAYPEPPGLASGQPWFQPQCHIGTEVMDPNKDPEAKPFEPFNRTSFTQTSAISSIKPAGTKPPGTIDGDYPAPAGSR